MSLLLDMLQESEASQEEKTSSSPADLPVKSMLSTHPVEEPSPINGLDLVWIQEEESGSEQASVSLDVKSVETDLPDLLSFDRVGDDDLIETRIGSDLLSDPIQEVSFPEMFAVEEEPLVEQLRREESVELSVIDFQSENRPVVEETDHANEIPLVMESREESHPLLLPLPLLDEPEVVNLAEKPSGLRRKKERWLLAGSATLLCGLMVGGYYYYEMMESDASLLLSPPKKRSVQSVVKQLPAAVPVLNPVALEKTATVEVTPPEAPSEPTLSNTRPVEQKEVSVVEAPPPVEMVSPPVVNPPLLPSAPIEPMQQASPQGVVMPPEVAVEQMTPVITLPPVEREVVVKKPVVAPLPKNHLHLGRMAFLTGDLEGAKKSFKQVLTQEPHNHHAMAGMASIAIRENKIDEARMIYQAILQENPQNTLAIAAMISLTGNGDPIQIESDLQRLLQSAPNDVHLYFVLGNVYVEQKNWPEAQNAFFNAYRIDATNPDVIINLAVSLDQLGQEKSALKFYQEALDLLLKTHRNHFNTQSIQKRIAILQQRIEPS